MRRYTFTLLSLAAFLTVTSDVHFLAAQTTIDTTLVMSDGVKIDALYVYPAAPPPPAGYPGILWIHGLNESKENNRAKARIYAQAGYFGVAYSVRGQGSSEGELDFFTSERIRTDLNDIIEYTRTRPGVNPDRIAVIGASQGGLLAWTAAAFHMNVRTVISRISNGRFDEDFTRDGALNWTFARVVAITSARLNQNFRNQVSAAVNSGDNSVVSAAMTGYSTKQLESGVTAPVFFAVSYFDGFFDQTAALEQFASIPGVKRIITYPAGHEEPTVASQRDFTNSIHDRWLSYWLKDDTAQEGVTDPDSAVVMFDAGSNLPHVFTRDASEFWLQPGSTLPSGLSSKTFYFADNGLSESPQSTTNSRQITYVNFAGSTPTVFRSQPFAADAVIAGAYGNAVLFGDGSNQYQLNLLLFDVDPSTGTALPVTRGHFQVNANVPQQTDEMQFHLNSIMFTIKAGHVLEARVHGGIGFIPDASTDFGTIQLGVPKNSNDVLFFGGATPSRFTLYFYDASLASEGSAPVPLRTDLLQSYPNPFGPRTAYGASSVNLEYSLSAPSRVVLKIVSPLGREVETLVDDRMEAGRHIIRWDASRMPPGVYFCSLHTRNGVVTKLLVYTR